MSRPYRKFDDGDVIRADDWNEIQSVIKQEVRTHRHGGGDDGETDPAMLGGLLRAQSLHDGAVTAEKLAEDAVSSRVLADGSVQPEHFDPNAAINEHKILFDPDEPVGYAITEVTLRIPDEILASGDEILWAIPAGTPITNDVGDIVFRTSEPIALGNDEPSADVAVRCEEPGTQCNVPAGTLTRVGGALDPFLRAHISISQHGESAGGLDPADGQAPRAARAPVEFRVAAGAPRTFWVIPKGTRIAQDISVPGADPEYVAFVTRQSLSVFPGSGWVLAEAVNTGEAGNLPAGSLTEITSAAAALVAAVDQPEPATGGDATNNARVRLRFHLLDAAPETGVEIAQDTRVISASNVEFRTLAPLMLDAGGSDYALADPADPAQAAPLPNTPFEVDPQTRPRMEKIFDPELMRYVTAELDPVFVAPAEDPDARRVRFAFSARAPHAAWQVQAGARVTVSAQSSGTGSATVVPEFETQDTVTIMPRSGWVWANAITTNDDALPAGSLDTIDTVFAEPTLIGNVEVYQPLDAMMDGGVSSVLLRFRVLESAPLPANASEWTIPAGTQVRDIAGNIYTTTQSLIIDRGGAAMVEARSVIPIDYTEVPAGTLQRVLADSQVRVGNVVDTTVTPYLSVAQHVDATDGDRAAYIRARVMLELAISDRAPRTAWLIPRDTRLVRQTDPLRFETIDPLPVLPRTGWVWAEPFDDSSGGAISGHALARPDGLPAALADIVEIAQPDDAEETQNGPRVRVWFRIIDRAAPMQDNTWTIPAGTDLISDDESIHFVTTDALVIGHGGAWIGMTEAERAGTAGNHVTDLIGLANPDDFERLLAVTQPEPAKGGADGGSEGHHHLVTPGALPSHPLADSTVGPDQITEGAVTWDKLSDQLAGRLASIRDQLKAVEDALIDAEAIEALMQQRHRSADL